jgi:hypothetical protein
MTKVQTRFQLSRPLDDNDADNIARVHAVYGILAARPQPNQNELFVEYDSTRLSPDEVRVILTQRGIPII